MRTIEKKVLKFEVMPTKKSKEKLVFIQKKHCLVKVCRGLLIYQKVVFSSSVDLADQLNTPNQVIYVLACGPIL